MVPHGFCAAVGYSKLMLGNMDENGFPIALHLSFPVSRFMWPLQGMKRHREIQLLDGHPLPAAALSQGQIRSRTGASWENSPPPPRISTVPSPNPSGRQLRNVSLGGVLS